MDGIKWAEYIAFHRVNKDKQYCIQYPCDGHPDIIIGPVADGKAITAYAHKAYNNIISYEAFYNLITRSKWFLHYKQIVFYSRSLKYLTPVLKLP